MSSLYSLVKNPFVLHESLMIFDVSGLYFTSIICVGLSPAPYTSRHSGIFFFFSRMTSDSIAPNTSSPTSPTSSIASSNASATSTASSSNRNVFSYISIFISSTNVLSFFIFNCANSIDFLINSSLSSWLLYPSLILYPLLLFVIHHQMPKISINNVIPIIKYIFLVFCDIII